MRPLSPPPRGVDRGRGPRREGGPSSRRRPFSPPPSASSWDRDDRRPRGRELLPPLLAQESEKKPRQVSIPPVVSWFIGELPTAPSFDVNFLNFFS